MKNISKKQALKIARYGPLAPRKKKSMRVARMWSLRPRLALLLDAPKLLHRAFFTLLVFPRAGSGQQFFRFRAHFALRAGLTPRHSSHIPRSVLEDF